MPDTKNKSKIDTSTGGGKPTENSLSFQEKPDQEKTEKARANAEIEKETDAVGEKAKEIGADTDNLEEKETEFSEMVIDKLKKGLSQVYEAGAKVVDDLSQSAQEYAEKYKIESEIKKFQVEKDQLMTQLGHSIFKRYREKGIVSESFFNEEEIMDQFSQTETLDKKIIRAGKRLDNAK
jgi:hypothetical protein